MQTWPNSHVKTRSILKWNNLDNNIHCNDSFNLQESSRIYTVISDKNSKFVVSQKELNTLHD